MRIVFLAPFAVHPKSTTRWRVLPLARALAAAGHAVRVVIPPYDWPRHGGRRWRDGGVDVVNVGLAGGALQAPAMLSGLMRWTLAWQPDVVHCFKPAGYSGLAAWLLAGLPAAPPVVMDADDWEAGWAARSGYARPVQRLLAWQERDGLRQAAAVTAASRWLCDHIAALRGGPETILYLPNGSDLSQLPTRHRERSGSSRQAVLLYSRFVEHSPEQVWAVWREVLAQAPGACLWLAGAELPGRGSAARLCRLAGQAGERRSVRLLGWIPAATRPGVFAAADAAVLPVADSPLNRAKSPMRLVDLLAAGVPVATQAVGEYGVYVRDGETGLLAPAGDDRALAAAVLRLLREDGLGERLGAAAAQRMASDYAWSRLAGSALAAYQSVLA